VTKSLKQGVTRPVWEGINIKEICNETWIWIIALCFTIPTMTGAHETGKQTIASYENTSVNYAYEHWKQGGNSLIPFIFLDVRTPEEYAAGHIHSVHLIPLQELAGRINEMRRV